MAPVSANRFDEIYISFISLNPGNNIDFLRRIRECSSRRIVGDIGATIDIETVNDCFAEVAVSDC